MDEQAIAQIVATLRKRIGTTSEPTHTEVDGSMIRKFALATGETNPLHLDQAYAQRTRFGGIVAPPTFVAAFVHGHIPEIFVQDLPFQRMLHSEDAVASFRLIRLGDFITAYARFADAYSKTGARGPAIYQVADLYLSDAANKPVAEVRISAVSF